jgi:hypothetical protein
MCRKGRKARLAANWALKAELLVPVGWHLAGPEPAHELEERILFVQGGAATGSQPPAS